MLQTTQENLFYKILFWSNLRSGQYFNRISFKYFYEFLYWSFRWFQKIQNFLSTISFYLNYILSWSRGRVCTPLTGRFVQSLHLSCLAFLDVSYYIAYHFNMFTPHLLIHPPYNNFKSSRQDNRAAFLYWNLVWRSSLLVKYLSILHRCFSVALWDGCLSVAKWICVY